MESMPAALPRDDDFMLGGLTARATGVDAGSQPNRLKQPIIMTASQSDE